MQTPWKPMEIQMGILLDNFSIESDISTETEI